MGCKPTFSLLSSLLILTAMTQLLDASRQVPPGTKGTNGDKQGAWFIGKDGCFLPGFGQCTPPPADSSTGGSGDISEAPGPDSSGGGSSIAPSNPFHRYIPGGNDTFIPNPGVEIPIPRKSHTVADDDQP